MEHDNLNRKASLMPSQQSLEFNNDQSVLARPPLQVQELVDFRLKGYSLDRISDLTGYSKGWIARQRLLFQSKGFYGYEPVSIKKLKKKLSQDKLLPAIALELDLPLAGLKNYIIDYGIERKMSIEKIHYLRYKKRLTYGEISDYYGVTAYTLRTFLRTHSSEHNVKTEERI